MVRKGSRVQISKAAPEQEHAGVLFLLQSELPLPFHVPRGGIGRGLEFKSRRRLQNKNMQVFFFVAKVTTLPFHVPRGGIGRGCDFKSRRRLHVLTRNTSFHLVIFWVELRLCLLWLLRHHTLTHLMPTFGHG